MAPSAITEDYYMILGVDQTAERDLIIRSYRRLALKLHPDHNTERDATEAFQMLVRAYETLKDEDERRKYDLIYPSLRGRNGTSQYTQKAYTKPAPKSQSETADEAARLAALRKSKQERAAQWQANNAVFESSIFEIKRAIRRLEQEIKNLDSIFAAEAAEEAQKNSWTAWLLSPIYKRAEESEEEKSAKERARQERRIEKDMKERRMDAQKAKLIAVEFAMMTANTEKNAADARDDTRIQNILYMIHARERQERQEKDRLEREKMEQQMKQQWERQEKEKLERERKAQQMRQQRMEQERRERAAVEALLQAQQAKYREEIRRQQERYTYSDYTKTNTYQTRTTTCSHDGWWPKVQGRTACPECSDVWTYLLQCPSCDMKACPKCQAAVRPRRPRNGARKSQRQPPRVRTPSPDYYDYW